MAQDKTDFFIQKGKSRKMNELKMQDREIVTAYMNLENAVVKQAMRDVVSTVTPLALKKDAYNWLQSEDFYFILELLSDFFCFSMIVKKKEIDKFLDKWNKIYDIENTEISLEDELILD